MTDLAQLIYLRTLPQHDPTWQKIATGDLVRITTWFAYPAEKYKQLPSFRRKVVDITAIARGTSKAVVAGRSAARLLGLWVLPPKNESITLVRKSKSLPTKAAQDPRVRYRKMWLPAEHIVDVDGVRSTNVARTCVDIARMVSLEEGIMAMDSALVHKMVTHDELSGMVLQLSRAKGIARARLAVQFASALAESPYESYARGILIAEGLGSKIIAQYSFANGYRVDLCIDDAVVIEIDGHVKYDGTTYGKPVDEVIRAERQREKHIQNLGFVVLRYSPSELLYERPRVVSEVRAALKAVRSHRSA